MRQAAGVVTGFVLALLAQTSVIADPYVAAAQVAQRLGVATAVIATDADAEAVRQRVAAALARPLDADTAVEIAVLNNRALQAAYIAGEHEFAALETALDLVGETRRAYFNAVAAQQVASYLERALASAEATAELTRRLAQAGGANRLDQARAAELYVKVANDVRRAQLDATLAREELTRALGLWGAEAGYTLPTLPPLPASIEVAAGVEAEAVRGRVDLMAARHAVAHEGAPAAHRLEALAIQVRSEVRAAFAAYQASYEIARAYRDDVIPLRRTIDEEIVYRYNGMLVDVFTVLATVRESVAANVAAISALRDFHLAEANLRATLIGGAVAPTAKGGITPHVDAAPGGH